MGVRMEEAEKKTAQLISALTEERTDTVVKRIRTILVKAPEQIPSEQQLMECAKELEQIPLEDPRSSQLCQQIEELKWKKRRRDAIQAKVDERLEAVGKQLDELADQFPQLKTTAKQPKSKKKQQRAKGKKPSPGPEKPSSREEQIGELKKGLELLQSELLPTLGSLQKEAIEEGIPMEPSKEQEEQVALANQMVHSLEAELAKKVEEKERARLILAQINVLRSAVEATVVEGPEGEEETAHLDVGLAEAKAEQGAGGSQRAEGEAGQCGPDGGRQ
jgi:hypothetical protein